MGVRGTTPEKKSFLNSTHLALILKSQSFKEEDITFTLKQYLGRRKTKSLFSATQEEDKRLSMVTQPKSFKEEKKARRCLCFRPLALLLAYVGEATGNPR